MSLLNDALKAAEQRQDHPTSASLYTGARPASARPGGNGKFRVLAGLVLILAIALAWSLLRPMPTGSVDEAAHTASGAKAPPAEQAPKPADAPTPREPEAVTPTPVTASAEPGPETQDSVPAAPVSPETAAAAPPRDPGPAASSSPTESGPASSPVQTAERPDDTPEKTLEKPSSSVADASEPASPPPVKQVRETPEAIDRRARRELMVLLEQGRMADARRQLTALVNTQNAPRSRAVFARELLVRSQPRQALQWLPESLAAEHSALRLLRARALLQQGDQRAALETLQSRVPAVSAEHLPYRVTLATVLHQAGQPQASVAQWSELIAYDSSRAAWWLGLALALEDSGQRRSAIKAYAQAATLPGLSDTLAQHARQRLQALQAES